MMYVVGIVGVVILVLFGTVKYQALENKHIASQRDQAVQANKELAASIEGVRNSCKAATDKLRAIEAADAKRKTASAKRAADADAKGAKAQPKIDELAQRAMTARVSTANCAEATRILDELASERSGQ